MTDYIRWLRQACFKPWALTWRIFQLDGQTLYNFFSPVVESCCSDAVLGFGLIMLISVSLITWSIDPTYVIRTFIGNKNEWTCADSSDQCVLRGVCYPETWDVRQLKVLMWLVDSGQVITVACWDIYMLKRRPDSCWRTVCVQIYSVNIYIYRYILYMRRCVLPWWWS